jgi:glutathione S-transferase
MAALKLAIGNKNYSSWSMRPWLALRANDIPFAETLIPLYTANPADKEQILSFSRAGKVPVLVDGETVVWDSLAIIEYIAECYPEKKLWPDEAAARAHARSVCAEMHSGFVPLRSECGMNLRRPIRPVTLSPDAKANVTRIEEIWRECRARYGAKGPFLFGGFGAADAMYAPVVHRLRTYAIDVAPDTKAYMETMMALPAFQQWTREGLAETLVIDRFEDA